MELEVQGPGTDGVFQCCSNCTGIGAGSVRCFSWPFWDSWLLKHRTDPAPIPVQLEQQQQTGFVQPPGCLLEQRHA